MEFFVNIDGKLKMTKEKIDKPFLAIMTVQQLHDCKEQIPYYKELLHSLGSIRYCKGQIYKDCIIGTFMQANKYDNKSNQIAFGFYLSESSLLLIEDVGDLKAYIEKKFEYFENIAKPSEVLLNIMQSMIEDDVLYLSHVESQLEKNIDQLDHSDSMPMIDFVSQYRRKMSKLNLYYQQLINIGVLFQSKICSQYIDDSSNWQMFTLQNERLQQYVELLKDDINQLNQTYQSKQQIQQNKIMGVLTIVTTIFLPLNLLVGWYGMNFSTMKELDWQYGYPLVIILSIIIVVCEIIYFKKKKLF